MHEREYEGTSVRNVRVRGVSVRGVERCDMSVRGGEM